MEKATKKEFNNFLYALCVVGIFLVIYGVFAAMWVCFVVLAALYGVASWRADVIILVLIFGILGLLVKRIYERE